MLKLAGLQDDFEELVQFPMEGIKPADLSKKQKALLTMWANATSMRRWLSSKKQEVSEVIKDDDLYQEAIEKVI